MNGKMMVFSLEIPHEKCMKPRGGATHTQRYSYIKHSQFWIFLLFCWLFLDDSDLFFWEKNVRYAQSMTQSLIACLLMVQSSSTSI